MTDLLIKGATILTMEPSSAAPQYGDIVIRSGKIAAIGPDLSAKALPTTQVVDGSGQIAIPGLVNSHIHLWQSGLRAVAGNWTFGDYFVGMLVGISSRMMARDVGLATRIGAAEQLEGGVTTALDWSHALHTPEYADAAIEALTASGIRALFGHGTPGDDAAKWWHVSEVPHPSDVHRIAAQLQGNPMVSLALAARGPDFATDAIVAGDIALARDLGCLTSMHVAVNATSAAPRGGVARIGQLGLMGPDLNFVHGNSLSDDEIAMISSGGASISATPEVEMQMGMGFPITGKVLRAGGLLCLGTDVASAVGADMFTQMRIAIQTQRALDHAASLEQSDQPCENLLSARDILRCATLDGARALGLGDKVGSLAVGKEADIVLVRPGTPGNRSDYHDAYETVVFHTTAASVDTVIVGGKLHKHHGRMLNCPPSELHDELNAGAARLVQPAS